ncbi:hypothetical protein B7I61_21945 [Salmonella enterica]|nr:hypothetical protein [Salmonella enterica]
MKTEGLTMNQLAERNAEHVTTIAALESRCASLSAKLSMINDLMEVAEQANKLAQEAAEKLVQERNTLAAENAGLNKFIAASCFVQAGEELAWYPAIDHAPETPATDAFLAEVRASAIPEGYALVPQQIFLEPSDIELICSQCGDGHESGYGDFTDGLLWVGNIQRDDGSIVHGLHISSADYTEEGGVTVCEFAAQPRKGGAV